MLINGTISRDIDLRISTIVVYSWGIRGGGDSNTVGSYFIFVRWTNNKAGIHILKFIWRGVIDQVHKIFLALYIIIFCFLQLLISKIKIEVRFLLSSTQYPRPLIFLKQELGISFPNINPCRALSYSDLKHNRSLKNSIRNKKKKKKQNLICKKKSNMRGGGEFECSTWNYAKINGNLGNKSKTMGVINI